VEHRFVFVARIWPDGAEIGAWSSEAQGKQ
jgi:hypothetical protein